MRILNDSGSQFVSVRPSGGRHSNSSIHLRLSLSQRRMEESREEVRGRADWIPAATILKLHRTDTLTVNSYGVSEADAHSLGVACWHANTPSSLLESISCFLKYY